MHGYWSQPGRGDRPFIYTVTPLTQPPLRLPPSSARSKPEPFFVNALVTARQPTRPSTNPAGDHYPVAADSALPLGPVCFNAVVSFRGCDEATRRGGGGDVHVHQEPSAQERFADILASRPPEDWIPAPAVDIDWISALVPRSFVGTFPAVDMKKVDMRAFNEGKPLHERRELILYRLVEPPESSSSNGGSGGVQTQKQAVLSDDDYVAHALIHTYENDRNGFLMHMNHVGWGFKFGKVASMSNSIIIHTNPAGAVMKPGGWWVQEFMMPRSDDGRGLLHHKVWSPEGVHVATVYQDGLFRKAEVKKEVKKETAGKL
ncbi:hypothetical protein BX600DRAFT_471527 [Xylariales sp. PMI_506]|nr:hypothetical protein BX600DRAFT_471527 [Xylariales sp. PMI_506]